MNFKKNNFIIYCKTNGLRNQYFLKIPDKSVIFFTLSVLFIIITADVYSQNDTSKSVLKGVVSNEKDNRLSNVNLSVLNKITLEVFRAKSSSSGEYNFELPGGEYTMTVLLEGYSLYELDKIVLKNNSIRVQNIVLTTRIYSLEEIEVLGNSKQNQNDLRTSLFNVSPSSIKVLPGGLEDVMRSLKSLPGVTSPSDFTSQLVIRGSGPDQNLIVMDEVEVFNPYRLYGLVSMFNPETLADINLITGGFPAKYGDRLSAVLDVTNREGITDKYFGFITNINIASANVIFQGKNPLKVPGSWIISSRRTYYDLVLGPFARNSGLITDNSSFPSFEDLQFKIAAGPFNKHKFIFNGIFSKDGVDIIPGDERSDPDSVNVNDVTTNNVLAAGWYYNPSPGFLSKTTFSWYRNSGDNDFDGDILDPLIDKENLTPEQRDSLKAIGALLGFSFKSKYAFRKYSITNRSVIIKDKNKYEFGGGFDIIRNDLSYTLNLDDNFRSFINSIPGARALLEEFYLEGKDNYRGSIFGLVRFEIAERFFWQPSARLDYYSLLQKVYISPRFNLGYAFDQLTTLRTSVGLYYQSPGYEKLVDNQTFYDLQNPQITDLKAEQSVHFIIGIERWIDNSWFAKAEGYYKIFDNLITQQKLTAYRYKYYPADPNNKNPEYLKNPLNWVRTQNKLPFDSLTSVPVNAGHGNSYGIELSLERRYLGPKTKLYGWINYSISKAVRDWYGVETLFRFDQTHTLNLVLNYRLITWLELGARWSYASNFPFTKPVGITPRISNDSLVINPLTNQVIFNLDYGGDDNRFANRKPAYHRLDIRVSAFARFWKTDWAFYIDVINVYNRKNILGYDYSLSSNLQIKQSTIGMIPILPTIGINARF